MRSARHGAVDARSRHATATESTHRTTRTGSRTTNSAHATRIGATTARSFAAASAVSAASSNTPKSAVTTFHATLSAGVASTAFSAALHGLLCAARRG